MRFRRVFSWFLFGAAILTLLFAAGHPVAAAQTAAHSGLDPSNLDRTCKPCDDFYQFAVGGWLKNNPIPAEYPVWGSFVTLEDKNQQELRGILEAAAAHKDSTPGSNQQKIGDFYASCMDTAAVEAQGSKAIDAELAAIAGIKDRDGVLQEAARLQSAGVNVLFTFGSNQDFKDSAKVIGEANQGGLGLPDRDYYTRDDAQSKELRDKYVHHVGKIFELMGDSPEKAAAQAKTVLAIETALAQASMTNVQLRDPDAIYHKLPVAKLQELTPNISWSDYFRAVGSPSLTEINIGQPDFFTTLNGMLASVPAADWRTYLRWHLIQRYAGALSENFVQENFNFYGTTLTGTKELRPRWKRCASAVDRNLGEALGQLYVEKYFPPAAKARALAMVHNLIAALRDDLQTLPWMSPQTRQAATVKLEAFKVKIGYPDTWRDYSALKIESGSYLGNLRRAVEFESARDLAKIGKPVDRGEWGITPPTVDAYNNPQLNEIVFPAGILQPPFFDPAASDAYNYGAMGAVIGHEITHGFDDQGAKFDPQGNLKDWWTAEDLKRFQERGECVANQFSGYEVEKGLHENGKLVEGESIADLGGLAIAYAAYQKSLNGRPAPPEKDANGFTPEQIFFLGYVQTWTINSRPEYARLQVNTDPHPFPKFRAIGPISNMPEFARAFHCKKGDPMVRANVCKIW